MAWHGSDCTISQQHQDEAAYQFGKCQQVKHLRDRLSDAYRKQK